MADIATMVMHSPKPASLSSEVTYTTVKATAPDDLPGGHQFTIRMNGKVLKAKVPSGGVRKGDIFSIRIPVVEETQQSQTPTTKTVKVRAPTDLPEGYRFTAKIGDQTIVATVVSSMDKLDDAEP